MWKKMMIVFMIAASLHLASAQVPPFPFGNSTNDIILPRGNGGFSEALALPIPMAYYGENVTSVLQSTNGYILLLSGNAFVGFINIYVLFISTIRGGDNQNQISVRVGNKSTDLLLARDIIAGNGTIFNPKTIIVATWNNVEGQGLPAGIQNTFQLIVPYSDTGETWGIFAFSRLEFFSTPNGLSSAKTSLVGPMSTQTFFETNSNAAMNERLTGTNCNRTGVYVFRINKGGPTNAPSTSPSVTPTEAPSTAPSVAPTEVPTTAPTVTPSKSPTTVPTVTPSKTPTTAPTVTPSKTPTTVPTAHPTNSPNVSPTNTPTRAPSTPEKCGLFGWSLLCPGRHPVWFLLTLAGLVPTILFILVHI